MFKMRIIKIFNHKKCDSQSHFIITINCFLCVSVYIFLIDNKNIQTNVCLFIYLYLSFNIVIDKRFINNYFRNLQNGLILDILRSLTLIYLIIYFSFSLFLLLLLTIKCFDKIKEKLLIDVFRKKFQRLTAIIDKKRILIELKRFIIFFLCV